MGGAKNVVNFQYVNSRKKIIVFEYLDNKQYDVVYVEYYARNSASFAVVFCVFSTLAR